MPQLVAFRRRWAIGSDDFVYPGLGEIVLRFIWLIAVSVVFHLHKDAFDCTGGHLLQAYYIGLLTLLVLCILITGYIVYTSMQGTITNTWPRRKIPKLLYIKFAISVPELVWNIMGTYWAFGMSSGCENHVVMTVKGAVLCGWVICLIVVVGIAIVIDPLGGRKHDHHSGLESDDAEQLVAGATNAAKKVWEARCRFLCCCMGGDDQRTGAFSGIAELLSNFFQGVDLVATDIAGGLILVYREQERQQCQLSTVQVDTTHRDRGYETFTQTPACSLPPTSVEITDTGQAQTSGATPQSCVRALPMPKPWMRTDLMHHYMKFAMASYGWPLYIFTHLMTGACQLWSQCKCCACIASLGDVHDDNCCRCHTAAIRKTTGIHQDDIVYASFHNKIYEIPFFVCVDREQQTVVVSIRGTLSLKDAITDLTAECHTLEIDSLDSCVAHRGILMAAKYVQATLHRLQILEQAFDRAQGAKLVITGHSLGAGAASLLAILLKPKYPDLICFAYSPPGELMSMCASEYSREFTCSVVLGKDFIPRLGIHTMDDLKAKLLRAINDCDMPKYKLLASGLWQAFCGLPQLSEEEVNSTRMGRPLLNDRQANGHIGEQNNLELPKGISAAMHEAMHRSEHCRITQPPMYPPGQIMHILEVETNRSCFGIPDYYAVWTRPQEFTEVIVSPKMLSDHFPDAVLRALEQLKNNNFTPKLPPSQIVAV